MLQMRVNLPAEFELEEGVISQEGLDWMNTYMVLLGKNGFTQFKVVAVKD